ncbi:MAG: hypothetical protein M0R76_13545 [Proteobacteria bacterium]|nr:hypothetical protein [Pseudomonadota bacterium]
MKPGNHLLALLLGASLFAAACAATPTAPTTRADLFEEDDLGLSSAPPPVTEPFAWRKPPAPIADNGPWEVTGCRQKKGLTVAFTVSDDKTATGKIVEPGKAEILGYEAGEVIFTDLVANDFGAWRGKHKWRNAFGVERWDPIYMLMEGDILSATMTTDACFKKMESLAPPKAENADAEATAEPADKTDTEVREATDTNTSAAKTNPAPSQDSPKASPADAPQ